MRTSNMDHLVFLFKEIDRIELKHLNKECYYHLDHNLSDYYNWVMPPEYKRSLFGDKSSKWNTCSDMYYLMIRFYEHVTGHLPEVNFQMNNRAIYNLMNCLNVDEEKKRAVVFLFQKCTSVSESKRIKNASELKNTEAFRYLKENYNKS